MNVSRQVQASARAVVVGVVLVVLFASSTVAAEAKPGPPGPGNSSNAKACQKGGWQYLYTSTGRLFTSEADCTSYAAGGGTILTSPPPPPTRTLTVTVDGTGSGTITSAPTGIDCGSDCSEGYPDGTTVTLTAAPASGSAFAGWSNACSGLTCAVTMNADKIAAATFNLAPSNPVIDCAPVSLTFPDTAYGGRSAVQQVTCTNPGPGAASVSDTTLNSTQFAFLSTCTGQTLDPLESCTIDVTFEPTATGAASATLSVYHDGSNASPREISLSGLSPPNGTLTCDATKVFVYESSVTDHKDETITCTAGGGAGTAVAVNGVDETGSDRFRIVSTTCTGGKTLPSGASCTTTVRFQTSDNGTYNGELLTAHSGTNGPTETTALAGMACDICLP